MSVVGLDIGLQGLLLIGSLILVSFILLVGTKYRRWEVKM